MHNETDFYFHRHGDGEVHCHEPGEDGESAHEHEHEHEHEHSHDGGQAHGHVHTQSKAVANRLARAIGHLESVKRMVEDGRDCSEVLIQLAAVRSALNSTAKVILKDHMDHCIADAVKTGDTEEIAKINEAIDKFI